MSRPDLKTSGARGVSGSHGQWMGCRGKEAPAPFGCWRCSSRSSLPKHGKGGSRTHPAETQPARLSHTVDISHRSAAWQRYTRPPAAANSNVSGESLCFQISCPPLQPLGEAGSLQAAESLPAAQAKQRQHQPGLPLANPGLKLRLFL